MKQNSKVLIILLFILFFSTQAKANIIISEVFYDAVGVDTGKEWIELYNDSDSAFDLTGYELNASSGNYYSFSNNLEAKNCLVVCWNSEGTDNQNNLYTGTSDFSNMGNTAGWTALFNDSTHSSSTIVDYLEYGAAGNTWESAASSAGIWMAGDFIPNVAEGHSIEYLGIGDTSLSWRGQPNPTPGTCVPEPATLFLFSGLGSLLFKRASSVRGLASDKS